MPFRPKQPARYRSPGPAETNPAGCAARGRHRRSGCVALSSRSCECRTPSVQVLWIESSRLSQLSTGYSAIRLQRHLAGDAEADDGAWIAVAQLDARRRERGGWCFPGLVNPRRGQPRQLRHPAADVAAVRVELLALADRVEDAEERRGIGAAAGGPLPAEGVVGQVGIHQRIPEPAGTRLPGEQQVLYEERSHHHAHAVVYPAAGPELAQPGIDKWITRPALLPGAEPRRVLPPRESRKLRAQRLLGRLREVDEQMVRKLAPAQFGEELPVAPHRRGDGLGLSKAPYRLPHLTGADLAKVQVRRQPRCAHEVSPVAVQRVGQEAAAQEALQLGLGAGAARLPGRSQTIGPVGLRLQLQRSERQRRWPSGCRGVFARRGQGFGRFTRAQAGSPERGEHAEWVAGLVPDSPGLVQQCPTATLGL